MSEMRGPTFLILTALAGKPMHGYGIIQEIAALSAQRVVLLPGTLYNALDRLTAEGFVEREREEVIEGRLRRYYRLTDDGLGALTAEAKRLRELAKVAESRLRRAQPRTA